MTKVKFFNWKGNIFEYLADVEKELQRIMINDIQFDVPFFKGRTLKETKGRNISIKKRTYDKL